jgi:hypothetical protein
MNSYVLEICSAFSVRCQYSCIFICVKSHDPFAASVIISQLFQFTLFVASYLVSRTNSERLKSQLNTFKNIWGVQKYLISESNISLPLFTGTNLRLSDYSFTIAKQLWVSCSKTIVPHLTPIRSSNSLLLANIHGHIIVTHKYVNAYRLLHLDIRK